MSSAQWETAKGVKDGALGFKAQGETRRWRGLSPEGYHRRGQDGVGDRELEMTQSPTWVRPKWLRSH
jgi:hypothetical protein